MTHTDVLIIIALKEEFENISTLLQAELVPKTLEDETPYYKFRIPTLGNETIEVAMIFVGVMGNEESRAITKTCIKELKPKLVANVGIAGAIDNDIFLGDIVVATNVDNYIYRGKVKQKDTTQPLTFEDVEFGGQSLPTSPHWVTHIDNLAYVKRTVWQKLKLSQYDDYNNQIKERDRDYLEGKKYVRESLHLTTGPIASGPLVGASGEFKKKLLEKNRTFVALEMEAYGVLDAILHERDSKPDSIIVKAISDFGDERKKDLDNIDGGAIRAWAMRNAFRLLICFIEGLNFKSTNISVKQEAPTNTDNLADSIESMHAIVIGNHLKTPYDKPSCVTRVTFDAYSDLFKTIISCKEPLDGNIFEHIFIQFKARCNIVYAEGEAGTGKTSFLSVLYWYLMQKRKQEPSAPIPFLINFHRFNYYQSIEKAIEALVEQLKVLQHTALLHKPQELWVIVDGYDKFAKYQEAIWRCIDEALKGQAQIRIIGMRSSEIDARASNHKSLFLKFNAVQVNSPKFSEFVSRFMAISRYEGSEEHLLEKCKSIKIADIDIFTASLIIQHGEWVPKSFSGLLRKFCVDFLQSRHISIALSEVAEIAYKLEILEIPVSQIENHNYFIWELIDTHPRIKNYLIAFHICEQLRLMGASSKALSNEFNFVFPYKINQFCKEIINHDGRTLQEVLAGVKIILESEEATFTAKANACYIAGRVALNQFRNVALKTLEKFKDTLPKDDPRFSNSDEEKRSMLLARTLYISLSYLGQSSAQDEYIGQLLKNPRWDEFNRGFHLEYYGDAEYVPSFPLLSEDNLGECPKTFEQLSRRLRSDPKSPLLQIELYTLVSLAQHRHAAAALDKDTRNILILLIEEILQKHAPFICDLLREYIIMVKMHLALEGFSSVEPFHQLTQLKTTRRIGWVKRNILGGESVADHTLAAYFIGLYFLPEKMDVSQSLIYEAYSKDKILKMLLIHDWAEAVTGDILPEDHDEKMAIVERAIYTQIGMLGTYSGVAPMHCVEELWIEFEHRNTINSVLAKEIDRMENLVQLLIYQSRPETQVSDYLIWREGLIKEVRTDVGRKILGQLLKYYDNHQNEKRSVFTQK